MTSAKSVYVNRVKAIIFDRKERSRRQAEEQERRKAYQARLKVSLYFPFIYLLTPRKPNKLLTHAAHYNILGQ